MCLIEGVPSSAQCAVVLADYSLSIDQGACLVVMETTCEMLTRRLYQHSSGCLYFTDAYNHRRLIPRFTIDLDR